MNFFKKKIKKKIKIYYICQFVQGYDKICDVINKMKEDPDIDIKVLAFPDDIKNHPNNPELSFWREKFGNIVIDAVAGEGWFDLKQAKPYMVFVQRPYNNYLPEEYSTDNLAKFTKLCYIPYGYNLVNLHDVSLPEVFLKDLYFFFAENKYEYEYAKSIMDKYDNCYSMNFGYPSFDKKLRNLEIKYSAFDKIKGNNKLKVIWTPRWTTDTKLFQTNFFNYKDNFVDYFKKNKNMQLVFRPHPFAFKNFIEKGLMTKEEVDTYLESYDLFNMVYDQESEYFETFKHSDVLVTDYSSVIVDYFILGKPIILCDSDKNRYSRVLEEINRVCYHANSFEDIKRILIDLKNGKDSLKEKRIKLSKELFMIDIDTTTNKIINAIKEDFYS